MVQMSDLVSELEHWRNGRLLTLRGANNTFCSGVLNTNLAATSIPLTMRDASRECTTDVCEHALEKGILGSRFFVEL